MLAASVAAAGRCGTGWTASVFVMLTLRPYRTVMLPAESKAMSMFWNSTTQVPCCEVTRQLAS